MQTESEHGSKAGKELYPAWLAALVTLCTANPLTMSGRARCSLGTLLVKIFDTLLKGSFRFDPQQ